MGYGTSKQQEITMDEMKHNGMSMPENNGMMRSLSGDNLESCYNEINERMCKGIAFHEQLADYFCFIGLQGFKRMLEYQYMKECSEKRKLHKRYIDIHKKVLPVKQVTIPVFIPSDWNKYTTEDITDNIVPRLVKSALEQWYAWECETKEMLERKATEMQNSAKNSDADFVKEMIHDVEKEIKKINRMLEKLNGTGYNVTMVHSMQDSLHEKYKKKYNETFTNKYVRVPRARHDDDMEEMRQYRYIGF